MLFTSSPGLGRQALAYHVFRLAVVLIVGASLLTPLHIASMLRAWDRYDMAPGATTMQRVEQTEANTLAGVLIGAAGCLLCAVSYTGYRRHELQVYHGRTRRLSHQNRSRRASV